MTWTRRINLKQEDIQLISHVQLGWEQLANVKVHWQKRGIHKDNSHSEFILIKQHVDFSVYPVHLSAKLGDTPRVTAEIF
jgi:hypothetical protein